jgi:hypothetical protein
VSLAVPELSAGNGSSGEDSMVSEVPQIADSVSLETAAVPFGGHHIDPQYSALAACAVKIP